MANLASSMANQAFEMAVHLVCGEILRSSNTIEFNPDLKSSSDSSDEEEEFIYLTLLRQVRAV